MARKDKEKSKGTVSIPGGQSAQFMAAGGAGPLEEIAKMDNEGNVEMTNETEPIEAPKSLKLETYESVKVYDPITFGIFKTLLLNPQLYSGNANQEPGLVKTAIRLRQVAADAGLVPAVNDAKEN